MRHPRPTARVIHNNPPHVQRRRNRKPLLAAFLVAALFSTILSTSPVAAQSSAPTCPTSVTDPDGDGWGWIEETSTSCRMPAGSDAGGSDCVDSDGDGWGWNEATQSSCRIDNNTTGQEQEPEQSEPTSGECLDPDGDGWGWDGENTCRNDDPTASNAVRGRYELVYQVDESGSIVLGGTFVINVEQGRRWPASCRNPGLGVFDRRVVWDDIRDLQVQPNPGCDELRELLSSTATLVAPNVSVSTVDQILGFATLSFGSVRGADGHIVTRNPGTASEQTVEVDGFWYIATGLRRGQTYVFDVAATRGDEVGPSSTVQFTVPEEEGTVEENLASSPQFATFVAALTAVAVTSAATGLPPNLLQEVLREWITREAANYIAGLIPGCLPPWVDDLATTVAASVSAGDTPQQTLLKVLALAQVVDFDDVGTCESPNPSADLPTECSSPVVAPLNAPVGTELCAEDGVVIYRHQIGLWAVQGTNEIRQMDNDGVGQGLVEVPASALPLVPIAALVFALGAGFSLSMQSSEFGGVTVGADGFRRNYSTPEQAWDRWPDEYFTDLGQDEIEDLFSVESGTGPFEAYYELNSRVRMAVRPDDTAVLQYREGLLFFGDWFQTDREYEVLRPLGDAIVKFDAIDNTERGLERRTAGLPVPLSTSSSRARSHVLTSDHDQGQWQAHHLIPVNLIVAYDDMFIEAVDAGMANEILTGIYFTDAVHNVIMLPADATTQERHFTSTGVCLPIHNGFSAKHMTWDSFAEYGFFDPSLDGRQDGLFDIYSVWKAQNEGRDWNQIRWAVWSLEIFKLQSAMRRLIMADTAGEPGC